MTDGKSMSNQLWTDERIKDLVGGTLHTADSAEWLLRQLRNQYEAERTQLLARIAELEATQPPTCPKRVRMLTNYGYRLQAGSVYKVDCMYVFPSGSVAYDVITEFPDVVTVSVHHCEPVPDEA